MFSLHNLYPNPNPHTHKNTQLINWKEYGFNYKFYAKNNAIEMVD